MKQDAVVTINNLSIAFKTSRGEVSAVDRVSFHINKGEIFALVGESGCGKSTMASALMRLVREPGKITSGSILYGEHDLVQLKQKKMAEIRGREIGMIYQNPLDSLNPLQKVGNQIAEAVSLDRVPKREAWKRALNVLKGVQISDVEQRAQSYPFEHSGGMRQRVMIGMMMARTPKLLIADEPTTALDVTIQDQILRLLKETRDRHQTSVLLITHDFGIVAETADRVGIMYAGKLVEVGDVYDIFDQPLHPYTKLLMSALPTITKKEGRLKTIPGTVPDLASPPRGCRFYSRCPVSEDRCKDTEPDYREAGNGHVVACHVEVGQNG